jgi:hypothetical protein
MDALMKTNGESGPDIPVSVADVTLPKAKQYLMLLDEMTMAIIGKIMPGMQFVEVEGYGMKDNDDYMLLVNPVKKVASPPIEGEVGNDD